MTDTVINSGNAAILYDPALLNQISNSSFSPAGWATSSVVRGALRSAGRGNTVVVANDEQEFVLRHFIRGGLVGKLIHDSYLWTGRDRTRSFDEYRMLARLHALGLPVPRPAAARYVRHGLVYKADLITVRIPDVRPMSDLLIEKKMEPLFWKSLGELIARFHANGACHADLNAYNIQVSKTQDIYLLDFDRGRFRNPGSWQRGNLDRLLRSLRKIQLLDSRVNFSDKEWQFLASAYESALARS